MLGQPRFVTVDDFKNYWGIDLRNALRNDDNVSNQAERFLSRVEDRLMNWIDNNTFRRLPYECLNCYQLENFKKAILTQAMYMYRNGDLGIESGYDSEKGVVVNRNTLVELEVSQAAINYLSNAGLFNLVMKNRPRILRGYPATEIMSANPPECKPDSRHDCGCDKDDHCGSETISVGFINYDDPNDSGNLNLGGR